MVTGYKLTFVVGRKRDENRDRSDRDRLSMETNSLIQPYFYYCSVVWERPGIRTGSEASKNSKTSYDHKFSAGYISSTAPPLKKLGWDRCSKYPVDRRP